MTFSFDAAPTPENAPQVYHTNQKRIDYRPEIAGVILGIDRPDRNKIELKARPSGSDDRLRLQVEPGGEEDDGRKQRAGIDAHAGLAVLHPVSGRPG